MIEKKLILGIDPGLGGALALYDPAIQNLIEVYDMPVTRKNSYAKDKVDVHGLVSLIKMLEPRVLYSCLENVHAMPNQGVVSMFSFGEGFGAIKGVLAAFNIKIVDIEPTVWKTTLNLSRDKSASLERAQSLWPDHAAKFKRKIDNGRAEAALIAYFGARVFA